MFFLEKIIFLFSFLFVSAAIPLIQTIWFCLTRTDPSVLAEVNEWKKNLTAFSAKVVGTTLVFLNGSHTACRSQECNLGNLICDAMVRFVMLRV